MKKLIAVLFTLLILCSTASAATLNVGPTCKYKTIQSAVNAAKTGDTIQVASGTYKETVTVNGKFLNILGTKYPSIYGLKIDQGGVVNLNGFKIQKTGVKLQIIGNNIIRNNYIYATGIIVTYQSCCNNVIMNNQLTGCGISLSESMDNSITGNKISNAKVGLKLDNGATCTKITGNTFSGCGTGIIIPQYLKYLLVKNTYSKNKVNIEYY